MNKNKFIGTQDMEETSGNVAMIADFEGDESNLFDIEIDNELPILPMRNMVLFPGVVLPVVVGRQSSMKLIDHVSKNETIFGCLCQKSPEVDNPAEKDLYKIGTVAKVLRVLEMPDGNKTVILQGLCRFKMSAIITRVPYYKALVTKISETTPAANDTEFNALIESCKEHATKLIKLNDGMHQELTFAMSNIKNRSFLINFICSNIPFSVADKMQLLKKNSIIERSYELLTLLNRENQLAKLKANIQMRTREELDQQQREYFLQQQIKNIQDELGNGNNDDADNMLAKSRHKKWDAKFQEFFEKEVAKLRRINPQSPDYNVQLTYLQTILNLPWNEYTIDNLDIANAQKCLDKDHFGLEKVKERILEHLAVLKMRGDFKAPIICLYGPPGVGKTSLGNSIAKSLKRKYHRISLGGVHDESEIRGHRRTYIGAMPGRIIKGLLKVDSSNPVFILDEIDKVGQNAVNGDPASALLEVLDPEQNSAFHDNYLDIDYDLSKVMFIATANNINTIPQPLLDRMELIEVSGYITEEKIEIATNHLIPKEKKQLGLSGSKNIRIPKTTIEKIIEDYTRESGVRELEKKINKIFRKLALYYARDGKFPYKEVKPSNLTDILGVPPFSRDIYQGNDYAGVVTGLAWTSVGGEILYVETSLSKGKGGKLTLTGNLGDVMKESAVLALEYIKAHYSMLNIDPEIFDNWNIHIHVPEGAVPKDGPSAGITIATSLASALTQRKVKSNVAMTGEITLRGKVLPVGGIKEKILAAKRAGITDIIMCKDNKKNIDEIPEVYLKGVTFHYVENVKDVLNIALTDEKVSDCIDFTTKDNEDKK